MRMLDAFSGESGSGMGYHLAGFAEVDAVDIVQRKRNPFHFIKADAFEYIRQYGHLYDFIHASPDCHDHSRGNKGAHLSAGTGWQLTEVIGLLESIGVPYIVENVAGGQKYMKNPVLLCGSMFGKPLIRHRYFQSNIVLPQPEHRCWPKGSAKRGEVITISNKVTWQKAENRRVGLWREVMEMPWASRDGLLQAVPPFYTAYLGRYMLDAIRAGLPTLAWQHGQLELF
jgi:DNA (cytosine-5)-methyltransferase 1